MNVYRRLAACSERAVIQLRANDELTGNPQAGGRDVRARIRRAGK